MRRGQFRADQFEQHPSHDPCEIQGSCISRYIDEEVEARFLAPLALTLTTPADRRELPGLVAGYTSESNPFGLPAKTTTLHGLLARHSGME